MSCTINYYEDGSQYFLYNIGNEELTEDDKRGRVKKRREKRKDSGRETDRESESPQNASKEMNGKRSKREELKKSKKRCVRGKILSERDR